MSILLFWIGAGIIFLIIEFLTATFYGLALALASAVVAILVWALSETHFTLLQGSVFALSTIIFSILIPNYLKSSKPDAPQGMDKYLGVERSTKKIGNDLKISLDGVDYLIQSDDELKTGDRVKVIGHAGVSVKVKKI